MTTARVRRAWALFVGVLVLCAPALASACPVCAQDSDQSTLRVAGVFLTVPFVVVFFAVRAIVRAQRSE